MSEHAAVEVYEEDGVTTVRCACGAESSAYQPWKARAAHDAHEGIQNARAALRGATE